MRRFATLTAVLTAGILAAGCGDEVPTPQELEAPAAAMSIVDGANGGGEPVFFLPPLVPMPEITGTFNQTLAPAVYVCLKSILSEAAPVCGDDQALVVFGPTDITVETDHYQVNWDVAASGPATDVRYTVFVMLGEEPVASVDVVFADNGKAAKTVTDAFGLVDSRVLPLKFFIGDVFAPAGGGDYLATSLDYSGTGPNGLTTALGGAGFYAPEGWISPDLGPVNLIIAERSHTTEDPCLPTDAAGDLIQFGTCYDFYTLPDVGNFLEPVIIGQCQTAAAQAYPRGLQLAAYHPDEPTRDIDFLPNVAPPFTLDCSSFAYLTRDGSVGSYASALWRKAADLVVRPLHAFHRGLAGSGIDFSYHAWADPLHLAYQDGDGQTTAPGTAPATPLTVRAESRYTHDEDLDGLPDPDIDVVPYAGLDVTFEVVAGPDAVGTTAIVTTDGAGIAAYSPVFGVEGTYIIEASAPGAIETVEFTLAVDAAAGYLASGVVTYSGTPVEGITVTILDGTTFDVLANQTTDITGAFEFTLSTGGYYIRASGPDPYAQWGPASLDVYTTNVTRNIDIPKKLALLTPEQDATIADLTPTFTWEANPEAATYQIDVSTATGTTVLSQTVATTSFTPASGLDAGRYYWQVRGYDASSRWVAKQADIFWVNIEQPPLGIANVTGPTTLIIGQSATYSVTINGGTTALDYIVIQGWLETGGREVATGGFSIDCGSGNGILPGGAECTVGHDVGVPTVASGNQVVPGSATLYLELRRIPPGGGWEALSTVSLSVQLTDSPA